MIAVWYEASANVRLARRLGPGLADFLNDPLASFLPPGDISVARIALGTDKGIGAFFLPHLAGPEINPEIVTIGFMQEKTIPALLGAKSFAIN
jgi:hypothetical protein